MKRGIRDFFVSNRSEAALDTTASAADSSPAPALASAQHCDIDCTGDSSVDLDTDTTTKQPETASDEVKLCYNVPMYQNCTPQKNTAGLRGPLKNCCS